MHLDAYRVGKYSLQVAHESQEAVLIDPRGLLLVYEEPKAYHRYVIGCDPTFGISGWNRTLRTKDDARVDNAAIEIFRVGNPDVQVAEFVAPVDAESLAPICNLLGRMYGIGEEDGQALMCIEVYPGTGWMTQRELIQKYGYSNLPPWLTESGVSQRISNKIGWHSTRSTRQDLWSRGVGHLQKKRSVLNSQFLVEEMADCTPDSFLSVTGRARHGLHDDRVVAMLLSIWYGHEWSIAIEPTESAGLQSANAPEWQATAVSLDRMHELAEERFNELLGEIP